MTKWIGFIAARYVGRGPSPVFAVLGIFTGVLALTVILAVMNGFQLSFIESIVEISSYHVRLENPTEEAAEGISALALVKSALPFRELQVLIRGNTEGQQAAVIRGLPPDALERDKDMAERLVFEEGSFDIGSPDTVVLGAELALRLGVSLGDEVSLASLAGIMGEAVSSRFTVTGIFRSGFWEYDLGWGFAGIDTAKALSGDGDRLSLGIKLQNRWQDLRALGQIRKALDGLDGPAEGWALLSWRDYNRAFFGALRTEKLLMFILVGLIFIVVGLNIFQAQRRTVLERREEIGLLRALGAGDKAVRLIFVWDGFIIGAAGAGLGMALGLLIAFNIGSFFTVLESLVNFIISVLNGLSALMGHSAGGGEFAVFSPAVFYIKEIPSRVIPHEAVLIFLFGFLSALAAAWFASGKVSRMGPAEVLRYE